jgi:predicted metal-binding membrane protein
MLGGQGTPDAQPTPPGLGRDRATLVTGALLLVVAAVAWGGVLHQAGALPGAQPMAPLAPSPMRERAPAEPIGAAPMAGMPAVEPMPGMAMPPAAGSESAAPPLAGALAYLAAWGIMMAAMMLPSATPMIALYGAVHRHFARTGQRSVSTAGFALVYLALWVAFGVPVYLASVGLDMAAATSPALAERLPYLVAAVLVGAGLYQLTPLKWACLRVCRSPLGFLLGHWRAGYGGTLRLAGAHAAYCVGCCWALMVVLVAAGAMGLPWVLLLAAVVFVEKLLPGAAWTARGVGVALIALGALVAGQPDLAGVLRSAGMAGM